MRKKGKIERLVAIVEKNPGLDAIALKGKGWRPNVHGCLRGAERAGILEFRNGGWFVTEEILDRARDHARMLG